MNEQRAYIFVDDGYPESADFDTNYIERNPDPVTDPRDAEGTRADSIWLHSTGAIGFRRRHPIPTST